LIDEPTPLFYMTDPTDNPMVEPLIREFIAQNILLTDTGFPHKDDVSFLQEGIIDSLGVMELVEFVQKTFGVKVEQSEVTPEHFDSVARLAAFVRRKTAAARPSSS
jgi:acyl carrier protein